MQRKHVQSSNINSIGYDEDSERLEVEFNSGGIYHYYNVPKVIYLALMNAASHGVYLNQNIINKYTYRRIG
jgi:hypothetical protein